MLCILAHAGPQLIFHAGSFFFFFQRNILSISLTKVKGSDWRRIDYSRILITFIFNHTYFYLSSRKFMVEQCVKYLIVFLICNTSSNLRRLKTKTFLTPSRLRPILYRNQSIDLQSKSMDWFLYDIGLQCERVNQILRLMSIQFFRNYNKKSHWSLSLIRWEFIQVTQKFQMQLL